MAAARVKRVLRAPAKALRKYLLPEYEVLLKDNRLAFESLEAAHGAIAHLQEQERIQRERGDAMEGRLNDVEARLNDLQQAVLEERRLNLRIAELTDVVTELVLPLHDRDINPEKLKALAPDTL
ncbi:DUF6752 domain-containing protein [Geodermatophilus sp. URMC 64]